MAKAVAKAKTHELSDEVVDLYRQHAGEGFEGTTVDDFTIPLLYLLQKGSPQVDEGGPEYVEGAKPGLFYNSVTKEVYAMPLLFVPAHYSRVVTAWVPRDSGGGFRGEMTVAEAEALLGKSLSKNSNDVVERNDETVELVDTRRFFATLVRTDGTLDQAVISLSSTQIKKAATLNVRMQKYVYDDFNPPIFAQAWNLESVREENDQGSWYGWNFTDCVRLLDAEEFKQSKAFRDLILAGQVQAAEPVAEGVDDDIGF